MGDNSEGALGIGDQTVSNCGIPSLVEGLSHKVIIEVACGGSHTIACSEDGEAFAWGDASKGALGIGTNDGLEAQEGDFVFSPTQLTDLKRRGE